MALKTEEEVKEYIQNLGIEYRFSCFKEKNPEGCHLLGDYLEAIKHEYDKAAQVFKQNCDEHNYGKSCFNTGTNFCFGKGIQLDTKKALAYYKKACDFNYKEGCLHAGIILTVEDKSGSKAVELDFVNGLKYLEKACNTGDSMGCMMASRLYNRGAEGVPVDKVKAARFTEGACNGGNMIACMNLYRMYRKGDVVEKDESKALMFKEKAREIRDDRRVKNPIGLQQYT